MTPPMGWNSWNAFEKDIDEEKIREIADVMVGSGMRDAGYTYLVLDDAWMASERDENGRLVADPGKFPAGMKAMGDYIHSRGLKFGIYQDRGKMTCQQLPGSLGHEQIDMETFAEWGVDYIKMDSCFAENNGRMSSEDYAILRRCIRATGRPMVLSISDFGNAALGVGRQGVCPPVAYVERHLSLDGFGVRLRGNVGPATGPSTRPSTGSGSSPDPATGTIRTCSRSATSETWKRIGRRLETERISVSGVSLRPL